MIKYQHQLVHQDKVMINFVPTLNLGPNLRLNRFVSEISNRNHRSVLAKFCLGVAPIRLETGRYEYLLETERLCPLGQIHRKRK